MDSGIAYSALIALVWDVYIFALKRYFPDYSRAVLTVAISTFVALLYLPVTAVTYGPAAVLLLAELGATGVGIVAGTAILVGVALILFVDAFEVDDASYAAPINKFVPVFVLPIEILFLNQLLTGVQVLSIAAATAAIYVANYKGGVFLDPLRRAAQSRLTRLTLANAACYAASDVGERVTLQELDIPMGVFILTLSVGLALAVLPAAVRERPDVRGDLPKFAAAGVFVVVGEHTASAAFGLMPASVTSPIVDTQAIVAVVLGGVILREVRFGTRLVAAVPVIVGVSLIALGDTAALRALAG